ncbi:MAG TPA: PPOX class F420-dependent oxidoreductase [Vicinamibacteria bacterium]|nr:PPOX class F420-dependent oxidoreductase [Vicinamibacteria bacterium]
MSLAARAFLGEPRYATLATINHDGSPQQTAVWYDVEGDAILMNTTAGRLKYRNLLRDPRASLCVTDAYRVVTLSGWVQLDDDPARAQADIRRLATRYHGAEKAERLSRESFSRQRRVSIRLAMEHIVEDDFTEMFL